MNEKVDRTCATCACSIMQTNPNDVNHKQLFCQRNTPGYHIAKIEVPRLDKEGKQMLSPRGNLALTDTVDQPVFVYPPVMAGLRCFDGWRPIGLEPGDKWNPDLDQMKAMLESMLEPLLASMGIVCAPLDS